jgi:periplasmic protein TonB
VTTTGAMFDFIVDEKKDKRNKRVSQFLFVSGALHGVALVVLLVLDQLRVPVVSEPAVEITFVDFASLPPPPPPPPPPKKRTTPKKVEVKPQPVVPQEMMAPKEIPKQEEPPPPQEDTGDDSGSDEGVEGGVEGGVAGGVVGGVVSDQKPPPKIEPPKPPEPAILDQATVRKGRISGRDPAYPPQAESRQIEGTVIAKITIGVDGRVKSIVFLQTHPMFERNIRQAVEGWAFRPHIVGGRPVPVITTYKFVFRLQ